jgi:hypothetical protein
MTMKSVFKGKQFYKGNMHAHSTVSDGELTPDESVEEYKKRGYQFLMFTEHEIYSNYSRFNSADFITIQGYEARVKLPPGDIRDYHFIIMPGSDEAMKKAKKPMFSHGQNLGIPYCSGYEDLQRDIDDKLDRGYMVMINHPFWSRVEYDEILPLKGLFAVEVYNFSSQIVENMGESNVTWDALLRNGYRLWGTAVDDNHNRSAIDANICDSFGGFVCVKADSLTERDICNAIAEGSFYASMGPEIYEFSLDGDRVHFECSPAAMVYLNGHVRQIKHAVAEVGEPLITQFDAKLTGDEQYIRMECYDRNGKKAYTNPIFIK